MGLVPAALAFVLPALGAPPYLYSAMVALAGLADVVDGAVARATGSSSARGAFLDSFVDRVEDVLVTSATIFLGANFWIALAAIALSLLISYERARAEALGVRMEGVGLAERAERLLLLIAYGAARCISEPASEAILIVLVLLSVATVVARFLWAWRHLSAG